MMQHFHFPPSLFLSWNYYDYIPFRLLSLPNLLTVKFSVPHMLPDCSGQNGLFQPSHQSLHCPWKCWYLEGLRLQIHHTSRAVLVPYCVGHKNTRKPKELSYLNNFSHLHFPQTPKVFHSITVLVNENLVSSAEKSNLKLIREYHYPVNHKQGKKQA